MTDHIPSGSEKLSHAAQEYLIVIYKLGGADGQVPTSAIADRMQVQAPSVTGMLKKLAGMRVVTYSPYNGVGLTPAGRRAALEIIRHHRLLELYLNQVMGFGWDQVDEEAGKLEHVISEEFEERMSQALGNPTLDPHGDPIPSKDGQIREVMHTPLSDLAPGSRAVIRRVSDRSASMLKYLADIGFYPGVEVEVLDRAPFGGPQRVRSASGVHLIWTELGRQIFTEPLASAPSPGGPPGP